MEYAVLDIETTGLYPGAHDRIIEIAVVRLASDFRADSEFCTLLNPGRDLGPTWLHGIQAAEVLDAPCFEEIAGAISASLDGAVIVGHNTRFDLRFVHAEFSRLGFDIEYPSHIDTMSLALGAGVGSRRLHEACDLFGIETEHQHSALGDARATASLFVRYVEYFGYEHIKTWTAPRHGRVANHWPSLDTSRQALPREAAIDSGTRGQQFLAEIVAELPADSSTPGAWQAYYAVLDRALEDRRISEAEQEALRRTAQIEGLSREDLEIANSKYLETLVATAFADGMISTSEREDLQQVSRILGLDSKLEQYIEIGRTAAGKREKSPAVNLEVPLVGRSVYFTGALNGFINGERATREKACEIASMKGMRVVRPVTQKLDYLVTADPDLMSGKAKKARDYGIRILAEPVFWSLTGTQVE